MADRIVKPDTGNDLVLQNDDASAKIEINEDGTIVHTGTSSIDVSGGTFTTSSAQKTAIVDGGKGNLTQSDVGLGNVTNDAQVPASGGTFSGNVSFGDNNITNVGDIALDTISSDAGTSIGVTLGTDAGDDFNVGSGKLVVEGDTGQIGVGTDDPISPVQINVNATDSIPTNQLIQQADDNILVLRNTNNSANYSGIKLETRSSDASGWLIANEWQNTYLGDLVFRGRSDGSNSAERMRIDSSGNLKINSGYGSVATAYACRAWVNFDGTNAFSPNPSTSAIRGSGNVSSITDNGTGDYTVNFTNAMPDSNFCALGTGSQKANLTAVRNLQVQANLGTGSVRVLTDAITGMFDLDLIFVAIIR